MYNVQPHFSHLLTSWTLWCIILWDTCSLLHMTQKARNNTKIFYLEHNIRNFVFDFCSYIKRKVDFIDFYKLFIIIYLCLNEKQYILFGIQVILCTSYALTNSSCLSYKLWLVFLINQFTICFKTSYLCFCLRMRICCLITFSVIYICIM